MSDSITEATGAESSRRLPKAPSLVQVSKIRARSELYMCVVLYSVRSRTAYSYVYQEGASGTPCALHNDALGSHGWLEPALIREVDDEGDRPTFDSSNAYNQALYTGSTQQGEIEVDSDTIY